MSDDVAELVELASVYVKQISHLQAGLATVLDQVHHSPPPAPEGPRQRLARLFTLAA